MSKLTLHVPASLVAAAKREAANRKTSVSRLVSDYFRAFEAGLPAKTTNSLPPITSSLVGCIQGSEDDRESYIDYLETKHS